MGWPRIAKTHTKIRIKKNKKIKRKKKKRKKKPVDLVDRLKGIMAWPPPLRICSAVHAMHVSLNQYTMHNVPASSSQHKWTFVPNHGTWNENQTCWSHEHHLPCHCEQTARSAAAAEASDTVQCRPKGTSTDYAQHYSRCVQHSRGFTALMEPHFRFKNPHNQVQPTTGCRSWYHSI